MVNKAWLVTLVAVLCVRTPGLSAQQQPPPGSRTGNPTPGTPQPDAPNLADRITVTGCVRLVESSSARRDPNNPTDARFVLEKAERSKVVQPDTGTSTAAASATSASYRLRGIDAQLSPFVGSKVEISGEVIPSTAADAPMPTVQVEFVQKLSSTCP